MTLDFSGWDLNQLTLANFCKGSFLHTNSPQFLCPPLSTLIPEQRLSLRYGLAGCSHGCIWGRQRSPVLNGNLFALL